MKTVNVPLPDKLGMEVENYVKRLVYRRSGVDADSIAGIHMA
jgi:hypothetical protein